MKTGEKVLVLGAGKMVAAILTGLKSHMDLSSFFLYSPSGESAARLASSVGATAVTDLDNVSPDWILVGCKPQQLGSLKETLQERFSEVPYVSLLAALSEEDQKSILKITRLVRVMPNLPVQFQKGVSLISSESESAHAKKMNELFSKLGTSLIVRETELEELTLLTGSGPAFFYEFTRLLAEGFTSLSPDVREDLARKVLLGAAVSATREPGPLQTMTDAVTSKGGVTIAVLEGWREGKMFQLIKKGIEAGLKRTQELKKIIPRS